MIPLPEARAFVLSLCRRLPSETIPVAEALGRVLDESIVSRVNVPPFANTAMDGFAVQAADTLDAPRQLDIVATIAAGDNPTVTVGPGQAARIMTGAPLPAGADAIIMVELTSVDPTTERVLVKEPVPVGNHVRSPGEDISVGQAIFEPGITLGPGHLGVLCTLGLTSVRVIRQPTVGVISTGDELVEGDAPLQPGQIRDSNRRTLLSMVELAGATPINLGLVRDDPDQIRAAFADAVQRCDAVITSGGVSMGGFDYVKEVLRDVGDMRWMQVAIRPAKPLAFGTIEGVPVFGLPGNPVSSMVSFELFARPGLRQMMGCSTLDRPRRFATATGPLRTYGDGKTHFARVVATYGPGGFQIIPSGGQGSHQLFAMATANALAVLPDDEPIEVPYSVEIIELDG